MAKLFYIGWASKIRLALQYVHFFQIHMGGGGWGYDLNMLRLLKEDDVTGVWQSSILVQPFTECFLILSWYMPTGQDSFYIAEGTI